MSRFHGGSRPLWSRAFLLLYTGEVISAAGSALLLVALPLAVLDRGGTAGLGLVATIGTAAQAVGFVPGGYLADRFGPRRVLCAANVLRVLFGAGLAVQLSNPETSVAAIAAIVGLSALCGGVATPAGFAILPRVVGEAGLPRANSMLMGTLLLVGIAVPALGGVLLQSVGTAALVSVDALSFALAALALLLMGPVGSAETTTPGEQQPLPPLREAFRTAPALIPLLVVALIASVVLPAVDEIFIPVLAQSDLGVGGEGYGLLLAVVAAGSLVGTVLAGMLAEPRKSGLRARPGVLALLLLLSDGLWLVILARVPALGSAAGIGLACVCLFGTGFALGAGNILLLTIFQRTVPEAALGRVMSLMMLCNLVGAPVAAVLGAAAVQSWGTAISLVITGTWQVLATLGVLLSRSVRDLRAPVPG